MVKSRNCHRRLSTNFGNILHLAGGLTSGSGNVEVDDGEGGRRDSSSSLIKYFSDHMLRIVVDLCCNS